ncbi:MAG: DUF1570 domain-containing protein [Phycisphaerae bacterium]|nr:DUF1570 domain-containing protein [Phycisphaerae bacterium]
MQTLCAASIILSLAAAAPPHDGEHAASTSAPASRTAPCTMPASETAVAITPRFRLQYTGAAAEAHALAASAERVYDEILAFCAYHGLPVTPPPEKLEILFLTDVETYRACARLAGLGRIKTYGFYDEKTNRCVFVDVGADPEIADLRNALKRAAQNANTIKAQLDATTSDAGEITLTYGDGSQVTLPVEEARRTLSAAKAQLRQIQARYDRYTDEINRTVTRHEIAHQVFFNIGVLRRNGSTPSWFVEGLAVLFETPEIPYATKPRSINGARYNDLHEAVCPHESEESLNAAMVTTAVHEGRLLPLRNLVGASWENNRQQPSPSRREDGDTSLLYAQSWALVYYLHRQQKDKLGDYVRRIQRRTNANIGPEVEIRDFEAAFGPLDDAFTRRWAAWLVSPSPCSERP